MSRTNEHIHGDRRCALALGLSGAALAGLIYFEGLPAQAEAESAVYFETEADEADEAIESISLQPEPVVAAPAESSIPAPAPTDTRLAMATVAEADAAALPVAPPAPALVIVPSIEGLSLHKARKQLAAVGLKLAVRDEYGEKIERAYWSEYEVRKQKVDAGAEVEPGSTVKVKARVRLRYASGY
ncbi:PASTA domain-containing protein [Nannocystis exedens]|uniref:PASTA domain-containing protein n=1 Tax=Nannocystis exedens TaxID=54 RepID=A0A1I1XEW7_9BACT|nr:PASTA domain-containing protein [Nannocystis exedens]PCC73465.1 PASTA domain protein [Nannocystis exedens]SFE05897.1 PASTA domain-containing protein [Nannocystis exedens]